MDDRDKLNLIREQVLAIANEMHRAAMGPDDISAGQVDDWQDRLRDLLPDTMADDFAFTG